MLERQLSSLSFYLRQRNLLNIHGGRQALQQPVKVCYHSYLPNLTLCAWVTGAADSDDLKCILLQVLERQRNQTLHSLSWFSHFLENLTKRGQFDKPPIWSLLPLGTSSLTYHHTKYGNCATKHEKYPIALVEKQQYSGIISVIVISSQLEEHQVMNLLIN